MNKAVVREKIVQFIERLIQPESSSQAIALSFSLGTLIAILPTPGFGIFIGLLLILVFRMLNKIAMVLAITMWNPLLQLPVYYASYWLGSVLLNRSAPTVIEESWITLLTRHTQAFLVGNSVLAALISVFSYIMVVQLVSYYRKRRAIAEIIRIYQVRSEKAQSA
ncbi:DUF2062 domain-containing protein [Tunicatimonas pelagia]|uniref:DUF2062 domain-containing protein n=1 Tax=Tunicatimonas pelagia TaxID=931531 RepID=UPI0026657983|nr:DUF2062 domain-containing protein [Tunicatimonas pelagia]WKN42807.1 DUF2062 domain-containing protein [Tunicatimonas pelagia]